MKHANVSVFVPHAGCPHQCSFCSQRSISGVSNAPTGEDVRRLCEESVKRFRLHPYEAELAFFGGSFTAIEHEYMIELLEAAAPFVSSGVFKGIRISTRPDAIDNEILNLLSFYGVSAIELGAQSMNDEVLKLNARGHTAKDVSNAAEMISGAGFSLGLQMMTGLYGADEESDYETGRALEALYPDTVRIYPTLVMQGTDLAALYIADKYMPQEIDAAVKMCATLLKRFQERGIKVIRIGLHAQDTLEAGLLAGPYHPAFRELCEGRLMQENIEKSIVEMPQGDYIIFVAKKSISKIMGHGARTLENLSSMGYNVKVKCDAELGGFEFRLQFVR